MNFEIIERNIEKIGSVVSCKIVLGEKDIIEEIHIVSNGLRSPKQIVRDVQSVLIATYDIQVDHKKISVAEIMDESLKKAECRLKLLSVSHDNSGTKANVKVSLSDNKNTYEKILSGINTYRNVERMLVDATLKNVEEACGISDTFILEDIRTIPVSTEKAVIVVVMGLFDGIEKRFCGSCLIKNDFKEAVVKATLDAVNRYVSKMVVINAG
jgi:predicted nucleic-acid-binding protein